MHLLWMLILMDETVCFQNGRITRFDEVRQINDQVSLKRGAIRLTLPADTVDWKRTEAANTGRLSEELGKISRINPGRPTFEMSEVVISNIDVMNVPVVDLLLFLADIAQLNIYIDPSVSNQLKATYKLKNIPWRQAFELILTNAGLDYDYSPGGYRLLGGLR